MEIQPGNRNIIADSSPLFIGEIGTSHGGDPVKAREFIDFLAETGAHFAKFQYVIADEIIHPRTGIVPLPGGDTPLYSVFKSIERDIGFYSDIKEYCEKRAICFLCTPFGIESARNLKKIGARSIKIASPELNHYPLLHEVAGYGIPVILSTGVSRLSDIERALDIFADKPVLLHCVTSYPAPEDEYNISLIQSLKTVFGTVTGISDHSLHPWLVPALSALCGATIIEKHVTLSRKGDGLDDAIALMPDDFSLMITRTHEISAMGRTEGIALLEKEFGIERINRITGDGVKRLALSEQNNYGRTNRSVHALVTIKAGERLDTGNTALLRTEKILRPGLPPQYFSQLMGAVLARTVEAGEGIRLEDIVKYRE